MSKENLSLALIGRGYWGQNYIKTIRNLDGCSLEDSNIKGKNYSDLLQKTDIAGVIVASSTPSHYAVAKAFLEKGFNLLIEKPITQNYKEALMLQDLHKIHPTSVVMSGHILIYDLAYEEMKRNIKNVGAIKRLIFTGLGSQKRSDSNIIEEWSPHSTYLFNDLLAVRPQKVSVQKTRDNNIHLTYEFDNNVIGETYVGPFSPKKERSLQIIGTNGALVFDWSNLTKRLMLLSPNSSDKEIKFNTTIPPLAHEVSEFLKSIKTGAEPRTPLFQGVLTTEIIKYFNESLAKEGAQIRIPKNRTLS